MINLKNDKGITLSVLIVTIIVIIIITSISVKSGIDSYKDSQNTHKQSQMRIIQHAMYQIYIEKGQYNSSKSYPGTTVNIDNIPEQFKDKTKCYLLDKNALEEMGITTVDEDYSNNYIVNYETGEIYDVGNKLYFGGYAANNTSGDSTSSIVDF